MISGRIEVVDLHPDHWCNLIRGPDGKDGGRLAEGWLVLVCRQDRIVHASLRGLPCDALLGGSCRDLASLRASFGVQRVICMQEGLLARAIGRFDESLHMEMDYAEQLICALRAFRAERGTGLRIDPPTPPGPVPPYSLLQMAFDRLWPDGSSCLLYVIDEDLDALWSSLILRKKRGSVDLLSSDLLLGSEGLRPHAWRGDRARVLRLVTRRVAPVYLGLFSSLEAWRALLASPLDALTNADFVLDPAPRRLLWPASAASHAWLVLRWIRSRF
ncbi:MAG: hypothetical protein JXR96_27865 [Deltaproteobacteria bacterium]|nr:hypothetical protein [Deltaproteobacteria bacterium]